MMIVVISAEGRGVMAHRSKALKQLGLESDTELMPALRTLTEELIPTLQRADHGYDVFAVVTVEQFPPKLEATLAALPGVVVTPLGDEAMDEFRPWLTTVYDREPAEDDGVQTWSRKVGSTRCRQPMQGQVIEAVQESE
ncbi:hypothetical protein OAO01_08250 [Oligoflexia bacterium]|nr:hypothetical protein [Oligoflexia bacterium]